VWDGSVVVAGRLRGEQLAVDRFAGDGVPLFPFSWALGWSAWSRKSPQVGHRPCWAFRSRSPRLSSGGGVFMRRRSCGAMRREWSPDEQALVGRDWTLVGNKLGAGARSGRRSSPPPATTCATCSAASAWVSSTLCPRSSKFTSTAPGTEPTPADPSGTNQR